MATIKLPKNRPAARKTEGRTPVRPTGLKRAHPTPQQAEAQARQRPAKPAREQGKRDERGGRNERNDRRDPRGAPAPRHAGPARDPHSGFVRDERRASPPERDRDPRNAPRHDPRAAPPRDARGAPPPRRDPRDARHAPDARDPRDAHNARHPREWHEPHHPCDSRDPRDPRDLRDPRDQRNPHEVRDPRAGAPRRDPRTDGPPRDSRGEAPRRDPRDPRASGARPDARFEAPRRDPRSDAGPRHGDAPAPREPRPYGSGPASPNGRPERRPYMAPVRAVPARPRTEPADAAPTGETEHPRLSKRMSELGLASRREADDWIGRGLVRVDGAVVDQLGVRVAPNQRISVDPEARNEQSKRVTIVLNKPLGIVSGQAEDGHLPAVTLIQAASRWSGDAHPLQFHPSQLHHLVPAGRLDMDSTGLLVLTQDGRVAKDLIGADTEVEKEYVVHVAWSEQPDAAELNKVFPAEQLALLRSGMQIDGQKLKPAKVSWANDQHLRFVLREGKRRQIRRMCEQVGLQVLALKRIRIGRVALGEVPPGQWRYLGPFEKF